MIRYVHQGEMIPAWYGVAWIEFHSDRAACLPVPLNWIVACARAAWSFVRYGSRSVAYNQREAYRQGRRDASSNEGRKS